MFEAKGGHLEPAGATSKWGVPVPLFPDELLTSWLVRAALAHGCDPLVLTDWLWPKWRIWTTDLDRGLSPERLSVLAKASGVAVSAFEATCLRTIITAVASEPFEDSAIWPWVLALGSRNRKRQGGLQYCPLCLKEDKKPYYRVHWRLAWHTCCLQHGVSLLDRCPHCAAAIEPHRLSAFDGDVALCATCKRDLRDAEPSRYHPGSLAFQQAADRVVRREEIANFGISTLSSHQWFALSRYFVRLLRKMALGQSNGLATFAASLGVATDELASPATGLALEFLPVQERTVLLAGAWQLLSAGPEQLLVAAKESSLKSSALRERHQIIPPSIEGIIQQLPESHISRAKRKPQGLLVPRSPQAVKRMFARFQRKISRVG